MDDNEIVKVLEKEADFDCDMCSNDGENCLGEECASFISRVALDLINRQNSKIESLQERLDIADEETQLAHKANINYVIEAEKSKAKTLQSLAESIKVEFYKEFEELIPSVMSDKIDELVKEMVGVNETEDKTKCE